MGRRVLFVSKPVVPPWNDGSKNLVRDVAENLVRARATVMTTEGASFESANVSSEAIYVKSGGFAPALADNARVLARLLKKDDHDLWSFVFAPNQKTSYVAKAAIFAAKMRGFRGKVVQIVASAPASFQGVSRLLFGDVIVAMSEFTRGRLLGAGVTGDVRVIPPCARAPRAATDDEVKKLRAEYDLGDGPIVLYPGDYEVSSGAETVMRAIPSLVAARDDIRVLFACRAKTEKSHAVRAEIEGEILSTGLGPYTRHVGEVTDMAKLFAAASVVAFPVDELRGKVDLPLVLLEAMALGKPIVVARGGPLTALTHAPLVDPGNHEALVREIMSLIEEPSIYNHIAEAGKRLYNACYSPARVAAAYDDLFDEISR